MTGAAQHYSVLLRESVDALVLKTDGIYLDGTFGRGGHSRAILQKLDSAGSVIGFDKDPQAVEVGRELAESDGRFSIVHNSFARLLDELEQRKLIGRVSGVLLDLGVSSPQLDQAERGFSFSQDGPLDMRMDSSSGQSAAQWVNTVDEAEIARVLKEYGEERFARRMARAIVERRQQQPFTRTLDLADVVAAANPRWEREKHPATRAFQAIRIAVNSELDDLQQGLTAALDCLVPGGRIVVISFHSLEDRIVKRFFKREAQGIQYPKDIPITHSMQQQSLRLVQKPVKANAEEVAENTRSRSAIMRVAEKI